MDQSLFKPRALRESERGSPSCEQTAMTIHCGKRIFKPLVTKPLEFLGLKEKENLELRLRSLSAEELQLRHQSESFKIGSACTGVFINGSLMCVVPSNAVGAALNLRQLCVAIRTRRKIENAARENNGADLRGAGCSRVRHYVTGGLTKTAFAVLFLGQDDFFAVADKVADLNLACPIMELEHAHGKLFENVEGVQDFGGLPKQMLLDALGLEHNLTWEEVQQMDSVSTGLEAALGMGVAAEANVAMIVGEAAAVKAHNEVDGVLERRMARRENGFKTRIPSCSVRISCACRTHRAPSSL